MRPISPIVVCGPAYADRGADCVHHDADSAVQDEMHGIGRFPLAYDDFARPNLDPPAMLDQLVSILCSVEIGRHNDVGKKPGSAEGVFHLARETREYHPCAALIGDLLDLREAECRGRVDSSDEPKIKQQEAALLFRKQCLDLLV